MNPPLQELIVTPGWKVEYHQFHVIDTATAAADEEIRFLFKEDMYQARNDGSDRMIDLGWYPEFDLANGEFRLVLYAGDFRGELLREFRTKSRQSVVDTMNEWFNAVTDGNT